MKKFFTLVCLLFVITGIGTASDKYLNLEDFKSWDNSNNAVYDKRNQKVSISDQYSAIQIWYNDIISRIVIYTLIFRSDNFNCLILII